MNSFQLELFQQGGNEQVADVVMFVGEDASGHFGIAANHMRFITVLSMGLAQLRFSDGRREYLALPGGLLYFHDNRMTLHTRRYWRGNDFSEMQSLLKENVQAEAQSMHQIKSNLLQIEESMLRRLLELERQS